MLISLGTETSDQLQQAVREIESLLINEQYEKVASFNKDKISVEDLTSSVKEFGERVTKAPDYVFDNFEVLPLKKFGEKYYHLDFDLWIDGKESSLSLQINVNLKGQNPIIEVEDLHVM